MTLAADLGELRGWPRGRWALAAGILLVVAVVLAAVSGLPPFGEHAGAAWRYPLLGLVALGVGLDVATVLRPVAGAEMTLCDLRWPVLAAVGAGWAGRDAALSPALVVLLDVAAALLMLWALVQRIEQERYAARAGEAAVCLTCRPLVRRRPRGAEAAAAIRPLDVPSVRPDER